MRHELSAVEFSGPQAVLDAVRLAEDDLVRAGRITAAPTYVVDDGAELSVSATVAAGGLSRTQRRDARGAWWIRADPGAAWLRTEVTSRMTAIDRDDDERRQRPSAIGPHGRVPPQDR